VLPFLSEREIKLWTFKTFLFLCHFSPSSSEGDEAVKGHALPFHIL
jgi:hypothetical protein